MPDGFCATCKWLSRAGEDDGAAHYCAVPFPHHNRRDSRGNVNPDEPCSFDSVSMTHWSGPPASPAWTPRAETLAETPGLLRAYPYEPPAARPEYTKRAFDALCADYAELLERYDLESDWHPSAEDVRVRYLGRARRAMGGGK